MRTLRTPLYLTLIAALSVLLQGCGVSQRTISLRAPSKALATGSPGLIFVGAYDAATSYVTTDVVTYKGSAYVAIAPSRQVTPAGTAASQQSWAMLAQAGATGAQGPQGAVGPSGAVGPMGAEGPAGVAGRNGAPGTAGSAGAQGARGLPGSPGAAGANGLAGPAGPTGPAGPAGLRGVAGPAQPLPLAGRRFAVQGDSISALFHQAWQTVVIDRTGMTLVNQDARGGRRFDTAFECWGHPQIGAAPGVFESSLTAGSGTCGAEQTGLSDGMTLAQSLQNVDVLILELGTNDVHTALGSPGDALNAGTFYGNMRWVTESYLAAKPSLRIVMVTVQSNASASRDVVKLYADATVAYAGSMGIPVLNMMDLGGVNPISAPVLVPDGTHPGSFAFKTTYGPLIAQFVLGVL